MTRITVVGRCGTRLQSPVCSTVRRPGGWKRIMTAPGQWLASRKVHLTPATVTVSPISTHFRRPHGTCTVHVWGEVQMRRDGVRGCQADACPMTRRLYNRLAMMRGTLSIVSQMATLQDLGFRAMSSCKCMQLQNPTSEMERTPGGAPRPAWRWASCSRSGPRCAGTSGGTGRRSGPRGSASGTSAGTGRPSCLARTCRPRRACRAPPATAAAACLRAAAAGVSAQEANMSVETCRQVVECALTVYDVPRQVWSAFSKRLCPGVNLQC